VTAVAPTSLQHEALLGWRLWRILPFDTLDGASSFRLCAAGTRGTPKLWQPRQAAAAVCSRYRTTHEAPWFDCGCGFWAFRDRDEANDLLEDWLESGQGRDGVGWAIGRVSLWGRVVECELGWRSQFAYPYDLTVHPGIESMRCDLPDLARAADLARVIRDVYAVDVVAGEPRWIGEPDSPKEEPQKASLRKDLSGELRAAVEKIDGTLAELDRLRPHYRNLDPRYRYQDPRYRYLAWNLIDDDVLVAALTAALAAGKPGRGAVRARELLDHLPWSGEKEWDRNPYYHHALNVALALKRAMLRGRVVQYRRGGSWWGLPEGCVCAEFTVVEDRHTDFDRVVLEALRRAVDAAPSDAVPVVSVLQELGEPDERSPRATV
jgi:hypothetical protein